MSATPNTIVTIIGRPSAASDLAVRRWLERFLAAEQPGTSWTVVEPSADRRAA